MSNIPINNLPNSNERIVNFEFDLEYLKQKLQGYLSVDFEKIHPAYKITGEILFTITYVLQMLYKMDKMEEEIRLLKKKLKS